VITALLICFLSLTAFAEGGQAIIEQLAQNAWLPQQVRAEWRSTDPIMQRIAAHSDWQLSDPKPARMAGAVILTVSRETADQKPEKLSISGNLRIFGPSLTPKKDIRAGQPVTKENLQLTECEWTNLADSVIPPDSCPSNMQAGHSLIAQRPLTVRDLKPLPLVHRGQIVSYCLRDGSVSVRLSGRALNDGAVGEHVAIAVDMGATRKFDGTVAADGTVLAVR
jgi:flagella basal body P-ring formation protein FlgA